MQKLRELKTTEVKELREQILKAQNNKCRICKKEITEFTGCTLDHQHKTKSTPCGLDGAGLIRGVLCRGCNSAEGKIWNSMGRYMGLSTVQERVQILQNLIEYYNKDNYNIIHPSEVPKEPQVSKRQYNKLKNALKDSTKKIPQYPKSKKCTKVLKILFEETGISPYL